MWLQQANFRLRFLFITLTLGGRLGRQLRAFSRIPKWLGQLTVFRTQQVLPLRDPSSQLGRLLLHQAACFVKAGYGATILAALPSQHRSDIQSLSLLGPLVAYGRIAADQWMLKSFCEVHFLIDKGKECQDHDDQLAFELHCGKASATRGNAAIGLKSLRWT